MSLWWIFGYLAGERLFELYLSGRNKKILQAEGGKEFHIGSYRSLVVLHLLFLVSLMVESQPWMIPLDVLTSVCLTIFIALQAGRYWCIWALGKNWNARIIVVPGTTPIRRGPYRFLRHPNYLVVALEFIVIPLLMRAPVTLFIFFVANLVLLYQRIKLEERVLVSKTAYTEVIG